MALFEGPSLTDRLREQSAEVERMGEQSRDRHTVCSDAVQHLSVLLDPASGQAATLTAADGIRLHALLRNPAAVSDALRLVAHTLDQHIHAGAQQLADRLEN